MYSDHLLIAIGMVTTGADTELDEISEFAAKLVPTQCLENEQFETPLVFHSFVKTTQINIKKKSVRFENDDGNEYSSFTTVLKDFLEWLQFVIREARRKTDAYLIIALVGHFALWRDLKLFIRNCQSEESNVQDFISLWCQFADSGELLCYLKKKNMLENKMKTNLNDAYYHLFNESLPECANALQSATALAKILALGSFRQYLQHMEILTYQGLKLRYEKEKSNFRHFQDLMNNFGPDLVYIELLRRMARKRISFQDVQFIYWSSRNRNIFKRKIKNKHSLHLDNDETDELYQACKLLSKHCTCCILFAIQISNPLKCK